MLKLIAMGDAEIAAGQTYSARDVIAELRAKHSSAKRSPKA